MRLIANEWFKVYSRKTVLILFIILILLNAVLLYIGEHGDRTSYKPQAYKELYKSIDGLTNQEALTKLERERREYSFLFELAFLSDMRSPSEDSLGERFPDLDVPALIDKHNSGDYLRYTDHLMKELDLYNQVIYEVKDVCSYDEYLQKIDDDAKKLTSISIFTKPGTFAYRNIKKTPSDFEHLKGNILKADPSKGVKMAVESMPTDLIAVLLIIIVCISLVTREKEQACLKLVKTTYRGRLALIGSKYIVAVFSCILIGLLLYATNFLLAYYSYGFGDMGRLIQSVSGYVGSTFEINVFQYFVLFILAKLVVYILISTVVILICLSVNTSIGAYLANAIIFAISGLLYFTIPSSSIFALAKYVNLVAFIDTYKVFANYRNLNIFGYPVNYIPIFICTVIVGITLIAIVSFIVFSRGKEIKAPSKLIGNIKEKTGRGKKHQISGTVTVFAHELYKVLISGKALIILCVLIAFQVYSYKPLDETYSSIDDIYYKRYMVQLEGEISQEKELYLEDEQKRFEDISKQIQELYLSPDENYYKIQTLNRELVAQNAFQMVLEQHSYLKGIEEEHGLKGWFLYDSGYGMLTAKESNSKDLLLALLAIVVVIACFSSVFTIEYQSGMINVISPTRHGRGKSFYSKLMISLLISILIFSIVYLPEYYNVLNAYGTSAIHAPAFSMNHLHNLRFNISILGYLILINLIRLIGLVGVMMLIFAISVKLKSIISSALVSTIVLVMPILLSLLGINIFDYILLTPLLSGNILFKDYSLRLIEGNRLIYLVILFIITAIISLFAYLQIKPSRKRTLTSFTFLNRSKEKAV